MRTNYSYKTKSRKIKKQKKCEWYGEILESNKEGKYCSAYCREQMAYKRKRLRDHTTGPYVERKIKAKCPICNKEFIKQNATHLYCSKECYKIVQSKKYSRKQMIRFAILNRDNFTCQYCGRNPTDDGVKLEVDHINPRANNGSDDPTNLVTACEDCNKGKSSNLLEHELKFRMRLILKENKEPFALNK